MAEFTLPAFLQNKSADDIHESMLVELPEDIDASWGNHTWNVTRPTALEIAKMCEFILPEVIKIFCPDWSYGDFLTEHAKMRGITRRAATAATGEITITGAVGSTIPAGSLFATASVNDEPSVDYRTVAAVEIPDSGSITVGIECTQTGIIGNTGVNTIVLVGSRLTGVTGVTNAAAVTGGTEEEEDELLISRINDYDKAQGESFIGCVADYKRWAKSVPGVGEATVIPAQDESGIVTIILTDANGDPATPDLCTDVFNYIMCPDSPAERRAPINALLAVVPPETLEIAVSATVELEPGFTLASVRDNFLAKLAAYLPQAMEEGEIKYTRIAAALAATEGADDYTEMLIGINDGIGEIAFGTSNIRISNTQLPSVSASNLILNGGTVEDDVEAPEGTGGAMTYSELDDVVEGYYHNGVFYFDSACTTPIKGETGKIYTDLATNQLYRYDGSSYSTLGSNANINTMTESEIDEIVNETL